MAKPGLARDARRPARLAEDVCSGARVICAPLAQMPEDLQALAVLRADSVGGPENAHLARLRPALLARAAVALEIAAQILEKIGITHFDSHTVSRYRKRADVGKYPF